MNSSKCKDPRFWKRWFQSGAVKLPSLPQSDLKIVAIGSFFSGPAKGFSTLSLGDRIINSGPGWSVTGSVLAVVVPTKDYRVGTRLPKLPGNAVPADIFFN